MTPADRQPRHAYGRAGETARRDCRRSGSRPPRAEMVHLPRQGPRRDDWHAARARGPRVGYGG